jgi:membrane protein implicated in regulation of membrane protease activity|tara:strand:- start:68 stop:670 length:603 start_codon:yes stop_codon:yes gene_type:complete
MGLLDSLDIFELLGFGDATGLEMIFAASALVGGILFLIWFALMMIGGVTADIFEGLLGMEGVGDLGADASFKALTFQGLMAFLMFFGLAGLYTLKSTETSTIAIAVGGGAGFASMYFTGKLFQLFITLQSDGTVEISESVGSTGTVYLKIPDNGAGKVQVNFGGSMRTMNAKSHDNAEIDSGEFIEVVDTMGEILIVKRK